MLCCRTQPLVALHPHRGWGDDAVWGSGRGGRPGLFCQILLAVLFVGFLRVLIFLVLVWLLCREPTTHGDAVATDGTIKPYYRSS